MNQVKITAIKTLQLDNVGDGCPIKIETDAGLTGYGESGISAKLARDRIELIGKTTWVRRSRAFSRSKTRSS